MMALIGLMHMELFTKLSALHYFVLCFVDARALLQHIKQFNGQYGCSFCLHPGKCVENGKGFTCVYETTTPIP